MTPRKTRLHDRVPFGAPVEIWKYRSPTRVRAADISAGGLFLRSPDQLNEGSYLTVSLAIPGHQRFTSVCKVVRAQLGSRPRDPRGLALSFVDIKPKDRRAIVDYVAARTFHASIAA